MFCADVFELKLRSLLLCKLTPGVMSNLFADRIIVYAVPM